MYEAQRYVVTATKVRVLTPWVQDAKMIAVLVGTVTDDVRLSALPPLRVCAVKFTETARARILEVGRMAGYNITLGGWERGGKRCASALPELEFHSTQRY